jgi:hypothetical protein
VTGKGIMRRARLLTVVSALWWVAPRVLFAQAPALADGDDLDVTKRVIVDPKAKVPDEVVRKIPLPKPAPPAAPGKPDEKKPKDGGKPVEPDKPKPAEPGKPPAPGKPSQPAPDIREQGRAFGHQVSEEAKQRSEDARRNREPPPPAQPPPKGPPPKPPPKPPR